MLARYGGYWGNKIPGADQNQYRCLAVDRAICKGQRKKTSKKNHLVLQVGGCAKGQLPVHGKHLQAKNSQRRNEIGRLNGCRRKQVQRNTSNKLCIGIWNVKTLLKIKNWVACVQDRGKWKEVVEKVKIFN
jgi:hypothetical protein